MRFRPLSRPDLPLLQAWLAEPLVRRWWNHETSDAAIEHDFGPSIDGRDPAECFIAMLADRPLGLIQRYPVAAYDDYLEELSAVVPVAVGALSIDYLIGEASDRGRGLGAGMIAAFVATTWTARPEATQIVVPVAAGNRASWRALQRAGFARLGEGRLRPDNPIDPADHVIYAIGRAAGAP